MKERIEIRLFAEEAVQCLPPEVGEWLDDSVVRLMLEPGDPLIERVRAQEEDARSRDSFAVSYWLIHREYSPREIATAERLHLLVRPYFEPTGEECGTVYDDSSACPRCHVGARQVGPLRLDLKRIPKRDIAQTLGGELVVSARLAEMMDAASIQGYALGPVEGKNGKPSPDWYQLLLPRRGVELAPETKVGQEFFVPVPDEARCPGHVAGYRLLSEVFVKRSSVEQADWQATRLMIGPRGGLFRPQPVILISPKLYRLLVANKVKRFDVEVAHLG